jgi:hypothetical protein
MRKSPILVFESSAFVSVPGEDEATNPGIFGKALAQWLGTQLHLSGVAANEVIPEDFGWVIPVKSIGSPSASPVPVAKRRITAALSPSC